MTPPLCGALLGLAAAVGLLIAVLHSPALRRPRLEDRIAPYLRDTPAPSRLLAAEPRAAATPLGALERILRPVLGQAVGWLDRVVGGSRSVRRRLLALGSVQSLEDFRVEQVVWGAAGLLAGMTGAAGYAAVTARVSIVSALLLCGGGAMSGVLGRDWWLSAQVRRREEVILAEFPVVAELLALAVTAGEGPAGAMDRVCRLADGELSRELRGALGHARSGASLLQALQSLSERTSLDALARFVDGMVIAMERGTPLAEVLRAQAVDVREAGKRALLESGGRKEVAMMVPVVFLVLPVTVFFALFPGLISIVRLAH